MRSLTDLLTTSSGREFLEERGVHTALPSFIQRLAPPVSDRMISTLGLEPGPIVYHGHQLAVDYAPSVVAKFHTAHALASSVDVVNVWMDADRVGASTASSTLVGPQGERVRLVPQRHKNLEVRFAPVERDHLERAADAIDRWTGRQRTGMAEALRAPGLESLADASEALTTELVRARIGAGPHGIRLSQLMTGGVLTPPLRAVLTQRKEFVHAINAAIQDLVDADVDPQIRPLPETYVPLRYSCEADGRRLTMACEERSGEEAAVGRCPCGLEYRFGLGEDGIDRLMRTERWSPDVTLPIYLNDVASGLVAGKSSALYGLVLNEAARKVLAQDPIPVIIPEDTRRLGGEGPSLLTGYLESA